MEKNKGYTKQYRNDDPTTALSHKDQQEAMLLDTLDMEMEKNKKEISRVQKRINTYVEPQINKDLDHIAESRLRYEKLKKRKAPEKIEKNNSGLAGILALSDKVRD
jgi:TolA-binding protein